MLAYRNVVHGVGRLALGNLLGGSSDLSAALQSIIAIANTVTSQVTVKALYEAKRDQVEIMVSMRKLENDVAEYLVSSEYEMLRLRINKSDNLTDEADHLLKLFEYMRNGLNSADEWFNLTIEGDSNEKIRKNN